MKNLFIFLLFVVASLLSCNKQNYEVTMGVPEVGISAEKIDRQLIAYVPTGWNEFLIGKPITIEVVANQKEIILFKPDNVKIYYWNDKEWKEIENKISQYPPDFSFMLDPAKKDDPLFRGSTTVLPDLSGLSASEPVNLKIFVFGSISENGEEIDEKVGAFVDIKLNP